MAVLAVALIAWAMRSNTFLSAVVRIQKDPGNTAVSSGPYPFVLFSGYSWFPIYLRDTIGPEFPLGHSTGPGDSCRYSAPNSPSRSHPPERTGWLRRLCAESEIHACANCLVGCLKGTMPNPRCVVHRPSASSDLSAANASNPDSAPSCGWQRARRKDSRSAGNLKRSFFEMASKGGAYPKIPHNAGVRRAVAFSASTRAKKALDR